MNFRALKLSDLQIAACSAWRSPAGVLELPVFHVIPFFFDVAAGAMLPDVELGTPSEYDFTCKAISSTGVTPGTLIQIQWPDGRYLSNPGVDFYSFVGSGRRGRLVDPHKRMGAQQKIRLNIDNTGVAACSLEIFFEGVLHVPLTELS